MGSKLRECCKLTDEKLVEPFSRPRLEISRGWKGRGVSPTPPSGNIDSMVKGKKTLSKLATVSKIMRKFFPVLFSILFIQGNVVFSEPLCYFLLLRGSARIQKARTESLFQVGSEKVSIGIGDKIFTGAETRGELIFPDKSIFRIKSNTTLELLKDVVQLKVGETFFQFQKLGREFQVVTPSSTCGVLGTSFDVNVSSGGRTRIRVFSGKVSVRNSMTRGRGKFILTAGQTVETQISQPIPAKPGFFDPKKVPVDDFSSSIPSTKNSKSCNYPHTRDSKTCTQEPPPPGPVPPNVTAQPHECGTPPGANPENSPHGVQNQIMVVPTSGTREGRNCSQSESKDGRLCQKWLPSEPGFDRHDHIGGHEFEGSDTSGNHEEPLGNGSFISRTLDPRVCPIADTKNPQTCPVQKTKDPRICLEGPAKNPPIGTPFQTRGPRECKSQTTRDARMCVEPTKDPSMCAREPTKNPAKCAAPVTQNPKMCHDPTRDGMCAEQPTRVPRKCAAQNSQDPRVCQEPTKNPELCVGTPTSNPRFCPANRSKDPRVCLQSPTQEPTMCQESPTKDPASCVDNEKSNPSRGSGFSSKNPGICKSIPRNDPRKREFATKEASNCGPLKD